MRYGKEINGGAELLCRMVSERMIKHWQIDILTTCAVDYVRWKNELPKGLETLNGVNIFRFPVSRERFLYVFNFIYGILAKVVELQKTKRSRTVTFKRPILAAIYLFIFGPHFLGQFLEKVWMWLQGPSSAELTRFIKQNIARYDAFIFFTNSYATTYENITIVKDKAIVVPAAHDEPCLYFKLFESSTAHAKALIYSTLEEKKLFENRFPFARSIFNRIAGIGIENRQPGLSDRFRTKYNISGNYVIYVGRIEESKGCDTLFEYFLDYLKLKKVDVTLVLLGKPSMAIPENSKIVSLGFVSEEDKFDAISGANCLIMPSPYESLSIVLLEAWMSNIPVIVNGACEVLKGQCERAQGGLAYTNYSQFDDALSKILTDRDTSEKMARSGREFTERTYTWSKIENDYIDALKAVSKETLV